MPATPKYPIYIISKGRWESRLTVKALDAMGVPYRVVIEPQELDQYAAVIDRRKLLVLPFSNLGLGGIPARNWVWEHSISEGHERHWILDDNITRFYRFNHNTKINVESPATFIAVEEFVDRYENVPMAGMQYEFFVPRKNSTIPPITINTRIYSCILLTNGTKQLWRGRYNEDTDLSLRFLKAGQCTILFNAFLAKKVRTMVMKGGNTESLYLLGDKVDGRLLMAQSLQQQHPDVVQIKRRWNRWQHVVDYRPFKHNKLIRKPGIVIPDGTNEFGMKLILK